jgi:N-acetylglucosaminyldiphosphoundecaprenol N-acetyl-beta-D-mannosaminyltransferase
MIKERYLGVDVCCADMDGVINNIKTIIKERRPSFVVAINPEKIMKAQDDEELKNLLNSAALQIPDGVGVLLASKMNGGAIRSRVTGIDLMQNVCALAAQNNYRVFMLGAKPGVAERAAEILKERYNGLSVVGIRDGYFKDEKELCEEIKSSRADIMFVAMGSPKQENWITQNMDKLGVPFLMGVGGSYDVICGNIKRAPDWMCSLGLEWMYRLLKEPWRYKRMMVLPVFLGKVLGEKIKK